MSDIDALRSIAQTNATNIAQRVRYQAVSWRKELTCNLVHGILILNNTAVYIFWYAGIAPNMEISYKCIFGNISGITFTVLNTSGQGDLWKVTLPTEYSITAIGR